MLHGIISFNHEHLDYPQFLFCGSFNPLHSGHVSIVDYIYNKYKVPVDFEISLTNVEKSPIAFKEIRRRYEQMSTMTKLSFGRLYMTDDARYLEKARIFPDVTFVCGFDAIKALSDGRYYDNFEEVIKEFDELGTKWIVFPRHKEDGMVSTADDFKNFPPTLSKNMTIVEDFTPIKISSRKLRK